MISLKQINYALAVEKTLHFKKAAQMCNVSQSALSTAVSELEKQLGFQLFERNNKQVLITPAGNQFLAKARNIKLEMDDLYQMAQSQQGELSAPMSIGVIPTIGPYLLPKVLAALRQQFPAFSPRIVEEQSHVLLEMVRNGDIDTAILALPYDLEGLIAFEFWQEDFFWVSHKEQSPPDLAEISSEQIDSDKLMLLKDGHCLKEHALAACHMQRGPEDKIFNSTSLHTLVEMVACKLGTTLVPEMALSQLISHQPQLNTFHLNEPGPHRRIAFIIRPNYVRTNDVEVLMSLFRDALSEIHPATE